MMNTEQVETKNTAPRVVIGFNNKISADEARKVLGISYAHVIHLLNTRKIKGQKIGKEWVVDKDDVYSVRDSHVTKGRGPNNPRNKGKSNGFMSLGTSPDEIQLSFVISKEKYQLIALALEKSEGSKTLKDILMAKVDEMHDTIAKQVKAISF